jgi:hypothetical protein
MRHASSHIEIVPHAYYNQFISLPHTQDYTAHTLTNLQYTLLTHQILICPFYFIFISHATLVIHCSHQFSLHRT